MDNTTIKMNDIEKKSVNWLDQNNQDMIVSIFGDVGKHTRAAISSNSLPLGVAVEVDAIFNLN